VRRRALRVGATLLVTGLCTAYIVWKIDIGRTAHVLAHAKLGWFLASLAIMLGSVWPFAWRWQRLLAARGVHDSLRRLVRTYFVGYAAGQILPTSLGGDASRIYETMRRHPGSRAAAAGTVLLERALGGVATLALAAVGFAISLGHYDIGVYLWVELGFVAGAVVLDADARIASPRGASVPGGSD
jgi:glycosyltransferase 2 family protein